MKRYLVYIWYLTLLGCAPTTGLRVGAGITPGETEIARLIAIPYHGGSFETARGEVNLVLSYPLGTAMVRLDGIGGPTGTMPTDGTGGVGVGLTGGLRVLFCLAVIEPYIFGTSGIEYYHERWHKDEIVQDTFWGFPTEIGVGSRFPIANKKWITLDYRFFHQSNGAGKFNDCYPNPGFNTDILMLGYEFEF